VLAVSVIGLAYSDAIDPLALSVAAACLAVLAVFDRLRE
jgi:Na+/H+ antiporter NhaA